MKHFNYSILAAMLGATAALCACNKDLTSEEYVNATVKKADITISASGSRLTRATDINPEDEEKINSLQVFVFREDGKLDAYASGVEGSLQISCTEGQRLIYAIVNGPAMPKISSLSELKGKTALLHNNSIGSLVMFGGVKEEVYTGAEITVPVSRTVARIRISSINTDFTSEYYRNASFTIDAIYLVNVPCDIKYGLLTSDVQYSWNPAEWYNASMNMHEMSSLLEDNDINYPLTENDVYSVTHDFYCYPNHVTTDSSDLLWSPRYTRLVVETTLDGTKYYYPISIPDIRGNRTYTISNLTITRPGSTSADIPVTTAECSVSASIEAWTVGLSNTREI